MKKNSTLVLTKSKAMRLEPRWNYLEYEGIKNKNYVFFFDDCKISIPVERENLEINKYLFKVGEKSGDSITLEYLGPKKAGRKHL